MLEAGWEDAMDEVWVVAVEPEVARWVVGQKGGMEFFLSWGVGGVEAGREREGGWSFREGRRVLLVLLVDTHVWSTGRPHC